MCLTRGISSSRAMCLRSRLWQGDGRLGAGSDASRLGGLVGRRRFGELLVGGKIGNVFSRVLYTPRLVFGLDLVGVHLSTQIVRG